MRLICGNWKNWNPLLLVQTTFPKKHFNGITLTSRDFLKSKNDLFLTTFHKGS